MENNLVNELLQVQKSRCGLKYVDIVDDYVKEIPSRVGNSMKQPINSLNRNFSIFTKYQGRMLFNLERRFFATLWKLRKYKRK